MIYLIRYLFRIITAIFIIKILAEGTSRANIGNSIDIST